MRTIKRKLAILAAALTVAGTLILAPTGPAHAATRCEVTIDRITVRDIQENGADEIYFKVDGRRIPGGSRHITIQDSLLGLIFTRSPVIRVDTAAYVELWESDVGFDQRLGLPYAISCANDIGTLNIRYQEPGVDYTLTITVSPAPPAPPPPSDGGGIPSLPPTPPGRPPIHLP